MGNCVDGLKCPTIPYACFCALQLKTGSIIVGAINTLFGLIFGIHFLVLAVQELTHRVTSFLHGGIELLNGDYGLHSRDNHYGHNDFRVIFQEIVYLFLGALWIAELVTAAILVYAAVKDKESLSKHFIIVCIIQFVATILFIIASIIILYPGFLVLGILFIVWHIWCFLVAFSYYKE